MISTATGVENAAMRKLSVFPNPTDNYLKMNTFEDELITIYDQQGKMVMQQQTAEGLSTINVSGLIPGKYVVILLSKQNKERVSTVFIKK